MGNKYGARVIAHFIVDLCTREAKPISNLQLHKILYLIQIAYIGTFGKLLFDDEFEAWQYGPVLPKIYDEYSFNAGLRIRHEYPSEEFEQINGSDKGLIQEAVQMLREKDPWTLVTMTHREGEPWHTVWRNGTGNHATISNSLLMSCYAQ